MTLSPVEPSMTSTPELTGRAVGPIEAAPVKWPDRSHRTLAEIWRLSAEEVKEARESAGK